jgi:hypothetical protein
MQASALRWTWRRRPPIDPAVATIQGTEGQYPRTGSIVNPASQGPVAPAARAAGETFVDRKPA